MFAVTFAPAETETLTRDMYTLHAVADCVYLHGKADMTSKMTNATTSVWFMHMLRIKQGKIAELHVNYDALAMYKVLQDEPPADEETSP